MGERAKVTVKKPEATSGKSVHRTPEVQPSEPMSSPVEYVLHLQRTIGNRAVNRLLKSGVLQAKLKIGQPGDIYEQEADRVAEQVMRMTEPEYEEESVQTKPISDQITPVVQRQPEEEEEEEEREEEEEPIMPKLLSSEHPVLQRQAEEEEEEEEEQRRKEEEEPVMPKLISSEHPVLQRQAEEEEEEEGEEPIQPQGITSHTPEAALDLESRIRSMKGGGQPLPRSAINFFEPRLNRDFSQVRVHTDARAADVTKALNAKAFTVGRDVMFGAGQYAPGTATGKRLLSHELTHVVQQIRTTSANVLRAESRGEEPSQKLRTIMGKELIFFPDFIGKSEIAYQEIKNELGMDPRSPNLTTANLLRAKANITPWTEAHKIVFDQLLSEQDCRDRANKYLQGMIDFTQNLQMSHQNRLQLVTRYLELKDTDIVNIFMMRVISEGFEAIGEIPGVPAKIVAESLKVVWDTYNLAKASSAQNKMSISVIDAFQDIDKNFKRAITEIENIRSMVLQDYGKLLEMKKLTWPKSTLRIWQVLDRKYEIKLWKELLPKKWKHMTASDDPTFHKSIGWINGYIKKHPQDYITYRRGKKYYLFGLYKSKGYWVTSHWLGSGRHPFTHERAPSKLAKYLFDELGISRKEVFEKWNLPRQRFIMPSIPSW